MLFSELLVVPGGHRGPWLVDTSSWSLPLPSRGLSYLYVCPDLPLLIRTPVIRISAHPNPG